MYGAIIGDIVGSRFEWNNIKTKAFAFFAPECEFTDDSIATLAVYEALAACAGDWTTLSVRVVERFRYWGRLYPHKGWGARFQAWLADPDPRPYNSWGNGAAMRVSPCAWFGRTLDEVKDLAHKVTCVTHNHPEGLKGAEATAVAVFLARTGHDMAAIKTALDAYYRVDFTLDAVRPTYTFSEAAHETVPYALAAFYESTSFEDAVRNAISLGGDSDTLAAITGSIAEAYWGIPEPMRATADTYLRWPTPIVYPSGTDGPRPRVGEPR